MFGRYKVSDITPKPPKNKKPFSMLVLALICVVPALALLRSTVFSNNKNFLASENSTKYDIVVDLGEGGRFEPGSKPEFTKMDNGKWIHKYTPGKDPVKLPTPVKDGYTFEGWLVGNDQTPKPEYSIPTWNKENINLSVKWKVDKAVLLRGSVFDKLIKTIPGFENVTEIRFEKRVNLPSGVDLSDSGNNSISGYVQGNILYIVSTAEMYANKDCTYMFDSISNVTSIKFDNFNTSQVTNMSYMFERCSKLEHLDLSNWDSAQVTNMYSMFNRCSKLNYLNISGWNTSKVTDMSYMFFNCSNLATLNLVNLDTSQVTNMRAMFYGCSQLDTLDVTNFNTLNVTNMRSMFQECSGLKSLDLSSFNTSKVTSMMDMFNGCIALNNVNLIGFNTSQVTSMQGMFNNCGSLIRLDLNGFNTSKVTDLTNMFCNANSLRTINMKSFDFSKVASFANMFDGCRALSGEITITNTNSPGYNQMFRGCSSDLNAKFIVKYVSPETKNLAQNMVNTKNPEDHVYLYDPNSTLLAGPQFKQKVQAMSGFENVTQIKFTKGTPKPVHTDLSERQDGSITASIDHDTLNVVCYGDMSANANCNEMFKSFNKITSYTFDNFNTSNVTSMSDMFCGNSSLPGIDLQKFKTEKVTSMRGMFFGCSDLISMDLSILNTSKVSDMALMFTNCSKLRTVNLTGLNTSSLTTMQRMFRDCPSLTNLDFTNLDLSKVTNYVQTFKNCSDLTSEITITNTGNQNILEMFIGCSTSSNAEFWVKYSNNTAKEKARQMVNTKNPNDHVYLWEPKKSGLLPGPKFRDKLKTLPGLNRATEIRFINGTPKPGVDLSLAQNGSITAYVENNVAYVASNDIIEFNSDSSSMFHSLDPSFNVLKKISFSNIDTTKVTTMAGMFQPGFREDAWRLEEITGLTLFKTPNLTSMQNMFAGCRCLKSLDLSSFNTSNVTDMGGLCWEDWQLRSIDVSSFDTRKNEHFNGMFNECYNLPSIDISGWRYDSAWMMGHMFAACNLLKATMVINNPNIPYVDYALSWAAVEGDAEIRVDYTAGCREMAQRLVDTKGDDSSYVYLGNQVSGRTATLSFPRRVALALKYGMAPPSKMGEERTAVSSQPLPTPHQLTLINGTSAQYPKQVITVTSGKIPSLATPELNPQYAGQFGGYYYDEQFTKPVKAGDVITQDITIYARW